MKAFVRGYSTRMCARAAPANWDYSCSTSGRRMLGGIDGLSVASVVNAPDRATLLKTQDRRTRQNFGFCFPMLPPALIGITSGPARHSLPHFVFPASAVESKCRTAINRLTPQVPGCVRSPVSIWP